MDNQRQIRIVVTGPESTGKTTLAKQLAKTFNGRIIPEFAREYIEKLTDHYTFDDVENIAKTQVQQYQLARSGSEQIIFFDTWLIITKVWFNWVYQRIPGWLEDEIQNCPMDLYLLCRPDLPWEADPVRENGGENRIRLYDQYREQLELYGFNFVEIGGTGDARQHNAIDAIRKFYDQI